MALLSAACPTLLASEPNHWGGVAGCTESASVHGATPSGAGCKDPRARPECGPFGELPRGFWFWVLGVREDTATTSKAMQGVHRLPHRIPRGSAAALRSIFFAFRYHPSAIGSSLARCLCLAFDLWLIVVDPSERRTVRRCHLHTRPPPPNVWFTYLS